MRVSILVKTFFILLFSFTLVFLLNTYISYQRFSPLYIEENINNVKTSILNSVDSLENNVDLSDTPLESLSSETSFIRYTDNQVVETIGPNYLAISEILDFVIGIYDSEDSITDGKLIYHVELVDDIYHISYIYQFDIGDYLIISTRVQSLQNVDSVLNQINMTQSIFIVIAITILSVVISINISHPIKRINAYAKDISNLNFKHQLTLKRRDEFKDLVSSLNEMNFNLQKTYKELNEANRQLVSDIDFEKEQETKKKQLIMTINHEIKTPLAVMKGMIEGMIDGVGRYKDKDKYLNELLKQIQTIENITHDLTYTLKLEDKLKLEEMTHTSVISKHLSSMDLFASQRMVKIEKQIEETEIKMSEELLIILVSNLVKNAIIYSDDKRVSVTGEISNQSYIITVRNKGEIPEAEIEKLFDSYYRVKDKKQQNTGTGLGLFIVKQISELYHYSYKLFNDNGYVVAKITIDLK